MRDRGERKLLRRRAKVTVVCLVMLTSPMLPISQAPSASALEPPTAPVVLLEELEDPPTPTPLESPDIIPPTVPTGGSPHNAARTTYDFALVWNSSADDSPAPLQYQIRASRSISDLESLEGGDAWYSAWQSSTSLPFGMIGNTGDGIWYWQTRAVDESGNESAWSETWQVTVDTTAPAITFYEPADGSVYGGPHSSMMGISAATEDTSGFKEYRFELDGNDITGLMEVSGETRLTFDGLFDVNSFLEGGHVFRLVSVDSYGHVSELTKTVYVDKTAPVVSLELEDNQRLMGKVGIPFSVTDAHPGAHELIIEDMDGQRQAMREVSSPEETPSREVITNGSGLIYQWDTTDVEDGAYTVKLIARDRVGFESIALRTVVVDNIPEPAEVFVPVGFTGGGTDPLLEELSRHLSQPFEMPKVIDTFPLVPSDSPTIIDEKLLASTRVILPDTDRNAEPVAVMPTESGWRIFGVLWYWWLVVMVVAALGYRRWRVMQSITA